MADNLFIIIYMFILVADNLSIIKVIVLIKEMQAKMKISGGCGRRAVITPLPKSNHSSVQFLTVNFLWLGFQKEPNYNDYMYNYNIHTLHIIMHNCNNNIHTII